MERIYVVEDDDNIRDLIKIALEGFGYEVSSYEIGRGCLKNIWKQINRHWLSLI